MTRKRRTTKEDAPTDDEKNVRNALAEQRQLAIGNAVPRLLAIEREISAKNGTKSTIYKSLEAKGVDVDAFKLAMKRCKKPQETLDLFDQETMGLETIIRKILEGNHGDEVESDDDADTETTATAGQTDIEDGVDPAADAEDPESEDGLVGGEEAEGGTDGDESGPGVPAPASLAPADPAAAEKMRAAMAGAGAEGISSDDLPMPETELHKNVIPLKGGKTGFVDKTPRMSAKEANEALGTADDLLGTRH